MQRHRAPLNARSWTELVAAPLSLSGWLKKSLPWPSSSVGITAPLALRCAGKDAGADFIFQISPVPSLRSEAVAEPGEDHTPDKRGYIPAHLGCL